VFRLGAAIVATAETFKAKKNLTPTLSRERWFFPAPTFGGGSEVRAAAPARNRRGYLDYSVGKAVPG